MAGVIYADVLVIINIYITYLLLSLTAAFCKKKKSPLRLLTASVLSGFYSLIILVPQLSESTVGITKLFFSALLTAIAFGKMNLRQYIRSYLVFFAVNFVFGGLMLALWLFITPDGMYYNSSIVYFDIDAPTLLILTVVCYIILTFIERLAKHKAPTGTVYDCKIYVAGKSFFCHCFLDTGNSMKDCYNGNPVMIVNSAVISSLVAENPLESEVSMRLIPCNTLSGEGMLYGFSCEKVEISGIKEKYTVRNITVALTDRRIRQGSFDGVLPCDILNNTTNEREKIYAQKTDNRY